MSPAFPTFDPAPQHLLLDRRGSAPLATAWITLNRPAALNALNDALMDELGAALLQADADEGIGCIVLTGSEKAFAAGADIGVMAGLSYADATRGDFITRNWETLRRIRKPVIAAVAGHALGGGCAAGIACGRPIFQGATRGQSCRPSGRGMEAQAPREKTPITAALRPAKSRAT